MCFHVLFMLVSYECHHAYLFWNSLWANKAMPVILGLLLGMFFPSDVAVVFSITFCSLVGLTHLYLPSASLTY